MNVHLGFLAGTKNYSTCILFLPSEVTMKLANTIASYEIVVTIHYYYYQVTPFNTHHPPHALTY
jgi:hypothetical protein